MALLDSLLPWLRLGALTASGGETIQRRDAHAHTHPNRPTRVRPPRPDAPAACVRRVSLAAAVLMPNAATLVFAGRSGVGVSRMLAVAAAAAAVRVLALRALGGLVEPQLRAGLEAVRDPPPRAASRDITVTRSRASARLPQASRLVGVRTMVAVSATLTGAGVVAALRAARRGEPRPRERSGSRRTHGG